MTSLSLNCPSATSPSRIICARNTTMASSSRWPGMSTVTSIHLSSPVPFPFSPSPSPSLPTPPISSSSPLPLSPIWSYQRSFPTTWTFSTSAFTPTIASVPSAKHSLALPFADGRRSVSATKGRKEVGERASGRIGGCREREVWR